MKRNTLLLAGIVALGILLRLFILSQRGSLWFDEAFSAHFASLEVPRMLSYLRFENNPSLYFIVLHFWMKLVGSSDLAVRSLSMIFGVASLPFIYLLGTRLHSRVAGMFATFLAAISTFQVFYSTETRMYAMYEFLALAAVWLFWKVYEARGMRHDFILHASLFMLLLLMVWTHITAWLIVFTFAIYLLWQERFNMRKFVIRHSSLVITVGLLLLSFASWIINFVKLKVAAPLSQGYFFYIPPDKNFFLSALESFLVFGQDNAFIVTLLSVVMMGLLWFATRRRQGLRMPGGLASVDFLLCWLFVPLVIGFAFSNAIPRYFIAAAPALYLLLGIGFARYMEADPTKLRRLGLLFPIIMFALIIPDYPSLREVGHHEWDRLAGWVGQLSAVRCQVSRCLILVNPHSEVLPFERYYQGALQVVGFYPRDDADDRDLRIVKTNWISLNTNENIRRLADVTTGYDRVFLVTGGIDPVGRNLVPVWFWENGWGRADGQEFGRISVTLLERASPQKLR